MQNVIGVFPLELIKPQSKASCAMTTEYLNPIR